MFPLNHIRSLKWRHPSRFLQDSKFAPAMLSCRKKVRITDARMNEFIEAELTHFARRAKEVRPLLPLTLGRIVRMSSEPEEIAQLVAEELPVRFASRIRHIEKVRGWETVPDLKMLRDMHFKSFRELRMVEGESPDHFQEAIRNIRQRHIVIAPLFAEAVKVIQHDWLPETDEGDGWAPFAHERLEHWADTLLLSRISTEILMSHFLACIESKSLGKANKHGILSFKGHPAETCRKAASNVQRKYPCTVVVTSLGDDIEFCHIPRYLFYIMEEILTNSARAVVRKAQNSEETGTKRIHVTVCADMKGLVIRIQDEGGGMPFSSAEQIWSYGFSTHEYREEDEGSKVGTWLGTPDERPWGVSDGESPISGRGMGLRLSRLYASYLGGTLEAWNMPGLGMDTYLSFKRVDLESGETET